MTSREEVYAAIDTERAFQDEIWTPETTTSDGQHSLEEWFMYIEDYVREASHILSRQSRQRANPRALDIVRKVAAMAVCAMEQHGAPIRMKEAGESADSWLSDPVPATVAGKAMAAELGLLPADEPRPNSPEDLGVHKTPKAPLYSEAPGDALDSPSPVPLTPEGDVPVLRLSGNVREDMVVVAKAIASKAGTDWTQEIFDASKFKGSSGDEVGFRMPKDRTSDKWLATTMGKLTRRLADLGLAAKPEDVVF